MRKSFKIGALVWAKMKQCAPWPGRVVAPPEHMKRKVNKPSSHCIYFFGTHDYAWIEEFNIKHYLQHRDELKNASKLKSFKDAVAEIEECIENKDPGAVQADEEGDSIEESDENESLEPKKSAPKKARKNSGVKRAANSPSPVNKKPKLATTPLEENGTYRSVKVKSFEELLKRPAVQRPDTPPVDVGNASESLKNKNIEPSSLRFGFLGLGIMARGIVKNLINSEHRVNLWCETPSKCEEFKEQADAIKVGLVDTHDTPDDIVRNSDIIFCCLSDPRAAKDAVVDNCGVLHNNASLDGKGYVEMTGIDAETSKDIHELITGQGGRYLEAQIQGSKKDADEGNLVVLGAGNKTLFDDCQTCFRAMGRAAFYLGEVGYAAKVNSILQVINGIALAGLAESFALADRTGVSLKDVLEILSITNLNCTYLRDNADIIINERFQDCQYPLQYMQRDLRLAIQFADSLQQPLLMTSTANEIFKHSRRLGYDKHDASAVFLRARY